MEKPRRTGIALKQVIDREYGGKMPEWVRSKYAGVFQQYIFYYETNCRK